jgi:hypothetical protein
MEDETTIGGQIDFIMQHRNRSGQLGVSDTHSPADHMISIDSVSRINHHKI